jgi:hypothetical protein
MPIMRIHSERSYVPFEFSSFGLGKYSGVPAKDVLTAVKNVVGILITVARGQDNNDVVADLKRVEEWL